MKYLLQAIDARRDSVRLSDHELRDLLIEVRNGKDDRIEFTDSMVRLLEELKSSEHAVAFLTKVAKRDAPDYYDVIKNPMDLGTMLRNVRQGRYKSKAQFMRDLDLIWDNCLTYNSEPTHPLRRSVQVLRNKANHLLTYVNDTNDVKEALTQWQASLGLRARTSVPPPAIGEDDQAEGDTSVARDRVGSLAAQRLNAASLNDMPFEQRPALLRNADGMSTFEQMDALQTMLDTEFAEKHLLHRPNDGGNVAGPSALRLTPSALDLSNSGEMLRTLEGSHGGTLRQALTTAQKDDGEESSAARANGAGSGATGHEGVPYPFGASADEAQLGNSTLNSAAAWWNSMSHPSMLPAGHSQLWRSEQKPPKRVRYMNLRTGRKGLSRSAEGNRSADGKPATDYGAIAGGLNGGVDAMEQNVRTISQLRRIHNKFGRLQHHIQTGEPIPAELGILSSDEEEDDEQRTQMHNKAYKGNRRRKAPDALTVPTQDVLGNPFSKLSGEVASIVLQEKTDLLLAHAGFDGSHKCAADVVTDLAAEFLMNIGRSLRNYSDRFSSEMSVEELILHTLYENGGIDVRGMETYVADDVLRYGNKMSELLRKLRTSYRDALAGSELTMADEAAYFGQTNSLSTGSGAQYAGQAVDQENEHILPGGYSAGLADEDFFGFKDMGLDEELGIDVGRQLASMPSRMFSRRQAEGAGVAAKARLGPGSGQSGSTAILDHEPPPPFIPVSESAIAAQIGLLRPFLRDLIRSRGQWHATGQAEIDLPSGDINMETSAPPEATVDADQKDGYLVLPDEEQERQRYKVPPTGKMPRRAMKERKSGNASSASTQQAQNARGFAANGTARGFGDSTASTAKGSQTGGGNKAKPKKKQAEKAGRAAQLVSVK